MPDGRSIVYLTNGASQFAWRVSIDGPGQPVRVTNTPTSRPSVSPDGKWLLCRLRSTEPNKPLWRTAIVALDGSAAVRFYDGPRFGGPPILLQWHPNGRAFLYVDFAGGVSNIWMQDVAGGEPRQLTRFESGDIFAFDIARDGKRIVFSGGETTRDAVLIRDFR
jgi:Tol biopolymer transport system component